MSKTITVKGTGNVSVRPDYVVISMELESKHEIYDKAMGLAADNIALLTDALVNAGFEKEAIKTTNFNVNSDYDGYRDKDGNYKTVFEGYKVSHRLKIEFEFDSSRLSKALSAIGSCLARPELHIAFTVKDTTPIEEEMLRTAAANARRKAEILCDASGKKLGELLMIDYNWGRINIYSDTCYSLGDACMEDCSMMERSIDIEPDDISASDTATFVWEIV